jgi:hypothetical protein
VLDCISKQLHPGQWPEFDDHKEQFGRSRR